MRVQQNDQMLLSDQLRVSVDITPKSDLYLSGTYSMTDQAMRVASSMTLNPGTWRADMVLAIAKNFAFCSDQLRGTDFFPIRTQLGMGHIRSQCRGRGGVYRQADRCGCNWGISSRLPRPLGTEVERPR